SATLTNKTLTSPVINTPTITGWDLWQAASVQPTRQTATDSAIFTYTLRFAADMTSLLSNGMRLKFTQSSTVKQAIVTAVGSFSGGNTDVTVQCRNDQTITDTATNAITLCFYSGSWAPQGFKLDHTLWDFMTESTADDSQATP